MNNNIKTAIKRTPITMLIVAFCIIVFAMYSFVKYIAQVAFISNFLQGLLFENPEYILYSKQLWRFVTPIFLHFSFIHIAFNLLWFYIFNIKIEAHKGKLFNLIFILSTAIVSNYLQSLSQGYLFGGLSGVVYGILAYNFMYSYFFKDARFKFNEQLFYFALVFLFLPLIPGFEMLFGAAIANMAHFAGLIMGAVIAFIEYKLFNFK